MLDLVDIGESADDRASDGFNGIPDGSDDVPFCRLVGNFRQRRRPASDLDDFRCEFTVSFVGDHADTQDDLLHASRPQERARRRTDRGEIFPKLSRPGVQENHRRQHGLGCFSAESVEHQQRLDYSRCIHE